MSASHVARAEELRSKLEPVAEVLRARGCSVIVDTVGDATIAGTLMNVTFTGSPDAARQLRNDFERSARNQGIALRGIVCDVIRDGLRPGEQRVGFVAIFPRSKAA